MACVCRPVVSNQSKKRKRAGILGNNEESEGEVENLPSGDDDGGNVSVTRVSFRIVYCGGKMVVVQRVVLDLNEKRLEASDSLNLSPLE